MGSIDLLDGSTQVNWPVPIILGIFTIIVAVAVIWSHIRGRDHAVIVAKQVFVKTGRLARPRVSIMSKCYAFLRD